MRDDDIKEFALRGFGEAERLAALEDVLRRLREKYLLVVGSLGFEGSGRASFS